MVSKKQKGPEAFSISLNGQNSWTYWDGLSKILLPNNNFKSISFRNTAG